MHQTYAGKLKKESKVTVGAAKKKPLVKKKENRHQSQNINN